MRHKLKDSQYAANDVHVDELADKQHTPMLLSVREHRQLSLSFNDSVGWHVIVASILNTIASETFLLSIVVGDRHVGWLSDRKSRTSLDLDEIRACVKRCCRSLVQGGV